ncbi:HAD family hydrolase [Pseudoxanthobacter sp. M-2]|uniref:HAD family hydrolase n=1 Tax=Pseudoxanthobacter sp. M-2 TaxID=3078754 RepID=UPI0038FC4109
MPHPSISAILFDKDGTLLDYQSSWGQINRRAAMIAAKGDAAFAAQLMRFGGMDPDSGITFADGLLAAATAREIATAWVAEGAPFSADRLTALLDEEFCNSVGSVVPVTDLVALFSRLKRRGMTLGIASSDGKASIEKTVERFGLVPFVDFIAGYDSGYGVKPGGGMVTAFCAHTGVAPSAVAVVGDNGHDMEMAHAGGAGLRIGVLTGTGTRESLTPMSHMVLGSIEELEGVLFG